MHADELHRPTVVMITHHIEELPPSTSHVLLLDEGRVAAEGRPEDVIESQRLSQVYRCPLTVRREHGRFYIQVDPSAWKAWSSENTRLQFLS